MDSFFVVVLLLLLFLLFWYHSFGHSFSDRVSRKAHWFGRDILLLTYSDFGERS